MITRIIITDEIDRIKGTQQRMKDELVRVDGILKFLIELLNKGVHEFNSEKYRDINEAYQSIRDEDI